MADSLLADLLISRIRRDGSAPLQIQIANAIRDAISDGMLKAATRLPSSRTLAAALEVSRITVVTAYERLSADGYLRSDSTSGTLVADTLPQSTKPSLRASTARTLSERGEQLIRAPAGIQERKGAFVPGVCDTTCFPYQIWRRIQNRYLGEQHVDLMGYSNPGGYLPLRRALSDYLRVSRAVRTTPEQIIVTMGSNQSIDLCSRILADAGELAYVENPCHWATPILLRANGLDVEAIAVDHNGIQIERCARRPRLIVTTPSHQFPMGVTLSDERRAQLCEAAERWDAFVLEDDYDSEFRYDQRTLPSLQGADKNGRVILMGTFSKVMYPGMRLSYLVVPPDLVDSFAAASLRLYRPGHLSLQAAMADFIADGHFAKHIRRMRDIYGARHSELLRCLDRSFGDAHETSRNAVGLHMTVRIRDLVDFDTTISRSLEQGIYLRRLHTFNQGDPKFRDGFLLGFGALDVEAIRPSVQTFAHIVERVISVQDSR
ncbi:PLP-dependent aminotransferase family protein [Burkholderia sp. Bp8998]|uniref:MocR-like pyridoxine biosynthesis transcription factor PdxR n=1 Tax=Burkholderia sp. Bp8998 TaxID=2184557 RepID=UPI000F5A1823|nr:PLP-dependent aminotransferase family protein [Burkholderia sp. Bp8998]RQS08155.1 PLP-dependent aminotransferase family protein [Burkholderia sp. Bp8998]